MPDGMSCVSPGFNFERRVDTGAQVHARRARGRVLRQGIVATDPRIEHTNLQATASAVAGGRSISGHERRSKRALSFEFESVPRSADSARRSAPPAGAPAPLCWSCDSSRLPSCQYTVSALSSLSNARPSPTLLAAIMSRFLLASLVSALRSTCSVSAAKPTEERMRLATRNGGQHIGCPGQRQIERVAGLLDLLAGDLSTAIIGNRGGGDEHIRAERHWSGPRSTFVRRFPHRRARRRVVSESARARSLVQRERPLRAPLQRPHNPSCRSCDC